MAMQLTQLIAVTVIFEVYLSKISLLLAKIPAQGTTGMTSLSHVHRHVKNYHPIVPLSAY